MCCDVNIEHKNKLKLMLHHIKFYFVTSTHTFPQSQHLISLQDKDSQNIFSHTPPLSTGEIGLNLMKANFLRESKMGKSNVFHPWFFFLEVFWTSRTILFNIIIRVLSCVLKPKVREVAFHKKAPSFFSYSECSFDTKVCMNIETLSKR